MPTASHLRRGRCWCRARLAGARLLAPAARCGCVPGARPGGNYRKRTPTLLDAVNIEPLRGNVDAERDGFVAAVRNRSSASSRCTRAPPLARRRPASTPRSCAACAARCAGERNARARLRRAAEGRAGTRRMPGRRLPDCALSCLRLLDSAMTRQLDGVFDAAAVDEPPTPRTAPPARQFAVLSVVSALPRRTNTRVRLAAATVMRVSTRLGQAAAGGNAAGDQHSLLAAAASAPSSPSGLGAKALSALHRHSSFDTRLHA